MSHASNPQIRRGLAQARGHIDSVLAMLTENRSCLDLAQQLQAVESTIRTVKRALIHDHMQHCITDAVADRGADADQALRDLKQLTKYL